MKTFKLFTLIFALSIWSCNPESNLKGTDSDRITLKVDSLLNIMTLDEKVGQLSQYSTLWQMTGPVPTGGTEQALYQKIKDGRVGSMLNVVGVKEIRKAQELAVEHSRLGIPMIFGLDVIHGYQTIFPIPLAESASWEPDLARLSASIAAKEASAAGLNWTFAPMVDISRDARWGRVMEGAGEDTYLGCQFGQARVRGFQGDDLKSVHTVAACAKHFAGYGFAESGKDYNTVELTQHTLHNVILPPFKACLDAGVATFMNAFNTIDGVPCTANLELQRTILKGSWGFEGFVVSDWNSIGEMNEHGVVANDKEAAFKAIVAGSDMDMEGNCYSENLSELVESGEVNIELINDAVRRVLKLKFELGLFEDPYRYCDEEREKKWVNSPSFKKSAREIAKRSIVLLKNENKVLPLQKKGQKIAVIGALATDKDSPIGNWRAEAKKHSAVSLWEGFTNKIGTENLSLAEGPTYVQKEIEFVDFLNYNNSDRRGMTEAINTARQADVVVLAMGENCYQSGEARSQTEINFKGLQLELLNEILKVNKNVVVVLMNGRPLDLSPIVDRVPTILETWHLGSESGNAIADVVFGDYNPAGKLPMSFPRSVGQLPLYYNHQWTGRPHDNETVFSSRYTDNEKTALFPFGYGLSYSSFKYSDLSLSSSTLHRGGTLDLSLSLENTGDYDGEEVVQLYIRDVVASAARPVKELKAFKKILLKKGEKKDVVFQLTEKDLEFYTANRKWEAEIGEFEVWIGTNSQEGLKASFRLIEEDENLVI
ncbi:beta-glucosidase [Sediminitomix flava]|uniref:beta-glucosidase n=2 Tax=Sediminitomix flava TaxID=379075 RepID=A0A315YY42_SEDFL|nr:beta-glucosidase [Sediminitomix flava]